MSQTPPDMTNPENIAEQKKYLNISRFRMGLANLFFSGEESSLAGQKIMIVKYLGGTDRHIGLISSFSSFMALTQWLALPLLRKLCDVICSSFNLITLQMRGLHKESVGLHHRQLRTKYRYN